MAITSGSCFPICPTTNLGDSLGIPSTVVPCKVSTAFRNGDVLIVDTGNDLVPSNAASAGIFGVAMTTNAGFTTAASIDRDGVIGTDLINVALALPGVKFDGNMIEATPADHTGVYADDVRITSELLESDASGEEYGCLDDSVSAPTCITLGYVSPQIDTTGAVVNAGDWVWGREAGVGLLNPRLTFMFMASATVFGG